MQHRRPGAGCPLCPVSGPAWDWDDPATHGQQHRDAEALWEAWDGRPGWPSRVVQAAARIGVACTAQQARQHFSGHGVEQPHLSEAMDRERWLREAWSLSDRAQRIIDSVYRSRLLTTQQITQIFYRPGASNDASAQAMCWRDLPRLAQRHFLYRYYPNAEAAARRDAPPWFANQAVWLLGRRSVPFIEHRYATTVRPEHYTTMAAQVSVDLLIHDLRANGLYVALAHALQQRAGVLELPGGRDPLDWAAVPASVPPSNWYGVKHLRMGFHDRAEMIDREVMPDGFITLALARSGYGDGALPSCQLPFFVEYDHGSRTYGEVVDQLFTYDRLARSRAAGRRFPDLDVDGYAVPVVMVFSDRRRVDRARQRFLAHADAKRQRGRAPIFLVAEEDWLADPFADAIVHHAWDERGRGHGLLEVLLQASRRLIDRRAVLSQQVLTLDLTGAKPTPSGSYSPAEVQRQQERRRQEAEERRKEAERQMQRMLTHGTRAQQADAGSPAGRGAAPRPTPVRDAGSSTLPTIDRAAAGLPLDDLQLTGAPVIAPPVPAPRPSNPLHSPAR